MAETFDHDGKPVSHGRERVNGLRMHYLTAGEGPALLLIHGTPKMSYYWYRIFPLLTPHFTVVAPDCRGFGYTDKPPATDGYDSETNAKDMGELMTKLGHEKFFLHGEDRGAEFAYAVAATYPDRVTKLSFCEMMLSGLGLEEMTVFNKYNLTAQYEKRGVWNWHIPFFFIPHVPEMLIAGHEREFWEHFIKAECYNPTTLEAKALDEWISCVKSPGGNRGILETYRSYFQNAEFNQRMSKTKLRMPIMTIGAPEFFGPLVKEQMEKVSEGVAHSEVFEECGHSLALEKPEKLADRLKTFFLEKS